MTDHTHPNQADASALNLDAIKQRLTDASDHLDPAITARLRNARAAALQHYDARQTAPKFAWADAITAPLRHHPLFQASTAVVFVALLFGSYTLWQRQAPLEYDLVSVDDDIAILTDDLPVTAYTD
jgi:hypothetical protein